MMADLRHASLLIIISTIVKLSGGSLVLPRPPSSPNEIEKNGESRVSGVEKLFEDAKFYNEKSPTVIYRRINNRRSNGDDGDDRRFETGVSGSSTNVEKPNTDGYKLLEIEFSRRVGEGRGRGRGGGGGNVNDAINFGEILREVFRNEEEDEEEEKEEEEVEENKGGLKGIANKIMRKNEKKLDDYREKFYYLKKQNGVKIVPKNDFSNARKKYHDYSSVGKTILGANNYPRKVINGINENKNENENENENDNDGPQVVEIIDDYPDSNYPRGNYATAEFHTTENSLPTSSELPKQIPPPPSRLPSLTIFSQTTPVLKFMLRRTDILPGY